MSLATADYIELVEKMPIGSRLIIDDVPWDDYERLLSKIVDSPNIRLSYDQGVLEIMSPLPKHESLKVLFAPLFTVLMEELDLNFYSLGSTTFKLPEAARGVEPDDCFYFRKTDLIAGKDEIDPHHDPAPELVVEIDISHISMDKSPIYASLGVAELWRHNGTQLRFFRLIGHNYEEIEDSDLFPFLSAAVLNGFLLQGKRQGVIPMVKAFRNWIRANRQS